MAVLLCDTRQQEGRHTAKNRWWLEHGVVIVSKKLDFGDYMTAGSNIAVDTKRDIQELVMDVGRDHARFVREAERARAAGYRLIVLIEAPGRYNDRDELAAWVSTVCRRCRGCNPSTVVGRRCRRGSKPMQGGTLAKILGGLERNHGMRFEFAEKRNAARRVCEILGIEYEQT